MSVKRFLHGVWRFIFWGVWFTALLGCLAWLADPANRPSDPAEPPVLKCIVPDCPGHTGVPALPDGILEVDSTGEPIERPARPARPVLEDLQ